MSDCLNDEAEKEVEILNEEEEEFNRRQRLLEEAEKTEAEKMEEEEEEEEETREELFNRRRIERLLEEAKKIIEEEEEELFNKVRDYLFKEEEQRHILDLCYFMYPVEAQKALKNFAFIVDAFFKIENHLEAASLPLGKADDFQENILLPQPEALEQGKKAMVKNRITRTAPITLSQEAIEAQYVKTMTEAAAVLEEEFFNRRQRLLEEYEEEEETREELFNKVRDYLFYEEEQRQIVDMCYTVNPVEVKKALKMFAFVISALFKVENHPEAVSLPLGKADDFQETTLSVEDILLPQPEASEQGKKAMVKIRITASEKKYKTAEIPLYKKDIEAQYGKTMSEAAKALGVSLSTLKRKRKDAGISEWQGPSSTKRKVNNSSNQSAKNEEYDGAVQDSSPINKNENTLTIKAKYKEDTIKIYLCISEATFIIVEEKIGKKCNLTHGTYKLNYLDEDEEWILLASDEDMSDCMKSSRILGQNVVRLRVLPIPC